MLNLKTLTIYRDTQMFYSIVLASTMLVNILAHALPLKFDKKGLDHGVVDPQHIQVAKSFIEKKLKDNHQFSPQKIEKFISEIEQQKSQIQKDIFETKMIEKLELDLEKWSTARKKSKEDSNINSRYMIAFDQHLLPILHELLFKVKNQLDKESWEGLAADFIRGYLPFYTPNTFRTHWPFDIEMAYIVKRTLIPETFKIKSKKVEANNLMIEDHNINKINECLKDKRNVGYYLSEKEIQQLKLCNFDISKINPGVSPLWKKISEKELRHIHHEFSNEFPEPNQEVEFKKVILRGQGSPKFKVKFTASDGQEKKIKLKLGNEIHVDKSVSKILQLAGFNQDQMVHRDQVKMKLGKTSYHEFESLFANKYGLEGIQRLIHARGGDKNNEWVLMKDVLFEAKKDDELRLGPVDFGSWDLMNRREFRSYILILSWLGVVDTKIANFRFALRKDQGQFYPVVRLQDPGYSLAPTIFIRRPRSLLVADTAYTVNEFDLKFIRTNKNHSQITLLWNDFGRRQRNTDHTTYHDLKWMSRVIGNIKSRDIYKALIDSGMPEPVAKVYHLKLLHRRNHMIKSFDLENEIKLFKIPKLKDYNPYKHQKKPSIVNGKVKPTAFEGKTNVVHVQKTWATLLTNLSNIEIPISDWHKNKKYVSNKTSLHGLNAISHDLGISAIPGEFSSHEFPLDIGIKAILSRHVDKNPQIINIKNKNRLFRVIDEVTIRFDLDSKMLDNILKKTKVLGAHTRIEFFEKKFQYIHFVEKASQGYSSPFKLHKILSNIEKFSAFKLKKLEVIKSYHRIGISISAGAGVYLPQPTLSNELSFLVGINNKKAKYYFRDQYNQLHVYIDKLSYKPIGFNLDILSTSFFGSLVPLLKINLSNLKYNVKTKNIVFKFNKLERKNGHNLLTKKRRQEEYSALKDLRKNNLNRSKYSFVKDNFTFSSKGRFFHKNLGSFWLFNSEKSKSISLSKIKKPNGKIQFFLRHFSSKRNSTGLEYFSLILGNSDYLMKSRTRLRIDTEVDRDKPHKFVAILRIEDFSRSKQESSLLTLIDRLNNKYSQNSTKLLYRGFSLPKSDPPIKYKKIYGLTRIFINGEALLSCINKFTIKQLEAILKNHFKLSENSNLPEKFNLNKHTRFKNALSLLKKLKKEKIHTPNDAIYLSKTYHKLLYHLKIESYGIGILKQLVGMKNIYVMSEISGVHHSYSTNQDIQQQQRRRFAGNSWGTYHRRPPIQYFLKFNRLVRSSLLVGKLLSDSVSLGFLEIGTAPNLYQTFNTNVYF